MSDFDNRPPDEPAPDIQVDESLLPDYDPDAPVVNKTYDVERIVHSEIVVDPVEDNALAEPPTPPPSGEATENAQALPEPGPPEVIYIEGVPYTDPNVIEYDPDVGVEPPPVVTPPPSEYPGYIPPLGEPIYLSDRLTLDSGDDGEPVAGMRSAAPRAVGHVDELRAAVGQLSQRPWVWVDASTITGVADGTELTSVPSEGISGATALTDADDLRNEWVGPVYRAAGIEGKPALDFRPDPLNDDDSRRLIFQTTGTRNARGYISIFAVTRIHDDAAWDATAFTIAQLWQPGNTNVVKLLQARDSRTNTSKVSGVVYDATRGNSVDIERTRASATGTVMSTLAHDEAGATLLTAPADTTTQLTYTDALNRSTSSPQPLGPLVYSNDAQMFEIGPAFRGQIAELIIFRGDAPLGAHEIYAVRNYLSKKYNNLPLEAAPPAPAARNQVANPSGEINKIGTWTASNGSVTMSTAVAHTPPLFGSKHVTYTVGSTTDDGFWVSFHAPMARPYYGAFTIGSNRLAGGSVYVCAAQIVGVSMQAEFLALVGEQFYRVGTVPMGPTTMLPHEGPWQRIQGQIPAPEGATHYYLRVTVRGDLADPSPQLGTRLFLEGALVVDNGAVVGVTYLDGDQPGAVWEGQAHNSSSVRGLDTRPIVYVPVVAPPVDDQDPAPDVYGPDPESDGETGGNTRPPAKPKPVLVYRPENPVDVLNQSGIRQGGLCLSNDVAIGPLALNAQDEDGTVWLLTDAEGWWNLPDPEVPEIDKAWDDGSYETRGRYKSRVFTLNGVFVPRTPAQMPAARDALIRAINLCHRGDWFRTREGTVVKGSKVWLSGRPEITTNALSGKTEFSIGFRAPDPIKYELVGGQPPGYQSTTIAPLNHQLPGREYDQARVGDTWEAGEPLWRRHYNSSYPESFLGPSTVSLFNAGNAPTAPLLRLKGPSYGKVRIVNATSKQTTLVIRPLSKNETLEIDCMTRQVSLNGVRNMRRYLDTFTDWMKLVPGTNEIYFYDEQGADAKLEVRWQSGWIG